MADLKRNDLIFPELSYKIVGVLIEVHRQLGSNYQEAIYQRALAEEFKKQNIKFEEQVKVNITYKDKEIGYYKVDFLIEGKIILEIKKDKFFSRRNIEQVKAYLEAMQLKLGILANFTSARLEYKRILNIE